MNMDKFKGLVLGALATFCWASFYIVSRYFFGTDDDGLDPLWSSFLRYCISAIVLLICLSCMKQLPVLASSFRKDYKMLFLLGLIGIAGESTLLFYSMKFTTAARSNLLTNISPVATAVISWFITREVFSKGQICGMLMGFLGLCTVLFLRGGDKFASGDVSFLLGDCMAIAAGICWSLFTVMGERAVKQYGSLVIMCGAFIFGAVCMIPSMFLAKSHVTLNINTQGWLMILSIGLFSNALANVCWCAALKYLRPGVLGTFGYVSIIFTNILAFLCLGEKISVPYASCLVLILLGTTLMLKTPSKTKN